MPSITSVSTPAATRSRSMFLKLLILAGMTLIILIALFYVDSVISDRQTFRDQAVSSIATSYASEQLLVGPTLVQPYRVTTVETTTDLKGAKQTTNKYEDENYTIFPHELAVTGALKPSVRRHGLYRVTVYEFQGTLAGHFDVPPPTVKGNVQYGEPYLAFSIKDPRGIVGTPVMRVNSAAVPVQGALKTQAEQDSPVATGIAAGTNLRALLPALSGKPGSFDFSLDLTLAGTQSFQLAPLADNNRFDISSTWAEPLFAGEFLPRTRDLSAAGFHAVWEISSLASATQQQLNAHSEKTDSISITLNNTIDPYKLSDRAVKYGILFVLLTFGGFFLFEIGKRMLIHPVQYLLVGFCLTVFFLLLISFSEHIGFGTAYLLASVACIGLLTYYLIFVLRSAAYGLAFGGILATLYGAIYGLLVSEDNALLLGSLLLFGVIAVVMIATRKIDWYARTADTAPEPPTALPPLPPASPQVPL